LIITTSLWFRVCSLENLPGINGDEAWYGVQAFQILTGRSFAFRTPTGLPLNPFFTGMEVPLLLVFRPSFWILRAPAVLSGVLAVALIYWLGSRILDRTTALIAAMLLAVLPSAIGYSRFGWDASQTPLFTILALYCAFRGKTLAMLICFALCLLVHASNIFLFPVLLAPYLVALWIAEKEPTKRRLILALTVALGLLSLLLLVLIDSRSDRFLLASRVAPSNWLRFLGHYGRLISGVTLYEYVVGQLSPRTRELYDVGFWGLFLALLFIGLPRLIRDQCWDRVALIIGLALGALSLYLVTGPDVIQPHRERYGMYLIVPTILVIASLVTAALPRRDEAQFRIARRAGFAVMLLLGWMMLYSFKVHYFDALETTGGESHLAFRTSQVEPKQQAIQLILDDLVRRRQAAVRDHGKAQSPGNLNERIGREGRSVQPVIAENWWLYWPIRFLACGQSGVDVIPFDDDASFLILEDRAQRARSLTTLSSGGYAVAFAGGDFERLVSSTFPTDRLERWHILDYGGTRMITVFRVPSR
jgi:4-amino-4-deoxy-L-arabinose transferase-like glycosyltransferase